MSDGEKSAADLLELQLETIVERIRTIAKERQDDSIRLLELLRTLEHLHQEIRETFFQESLPDNRQSLYALLKDIETKGGWPYIYRPKIQALLKNLAEELNVDHCSTPSITDQANSIRSESFNCPLYNELSSEENLD